MDKDRFREAERVLRIAGFYLAAQNGHHKWVHPDGRIFIVPSTPGGGRGWRNARARLRKLGVPV